MPHLQQQLEFLKQRIRRIDRKYSGAPPPQRPSFDPRPVRYAVEQWLSGEEVETPHGRHFETERVYENHRRHGSMDIGSLGEQPEDILGALSDGAIPRSAPARWAFLDTETTGLAGGSGTVAFLVGVGRIAEDGFRVRQFFMRDHGEEPSLLWALEAHLAQFDILITYNGRVYDQPLLETRYRMARAKPPFARLEHLDLLFGARRLWKLRFESCRLVDLENQILGVEREGDLPGELIPYVYFEYLRTREAFRLAPVFHHNATDILTLACLAAIVPRAFHAPAETNHSAELVGLARWLQRAERYGDAREMMRRAVERGLPDDLLFRTLWDIALLEKKSGAAPAALALWTDLATSRNPFQAAALAELAKHSEHRERDYGRALDFTRRARELEDSAELRRREARLERRLAGTRAPRLL